MKNKLMLCSLLLLLVGFSTTISYSQTPTYTMTIANDAQTAANIYEFDIFLQRTGTDEFQLFGAQIGITYNPAIRGTGTFTATWVIGSSQLNAAQAPSAGNTATSGLIKIAARTVTNFGDGTVISNIAPGTKVGRLRLTGQNNFNSVSASIQFATTVYPVQIFAYDYTDNLSHDVTSKGTFIKNIVNGTLPIELNSFKSNVGERQVNLIWSTKTEINSNRFEIERALSGTKDATVVWKSVGVVQASGNSNAPKNYSYTEKDLQVGKYQYRLKLIDNNGSFKYSDVVESEIAVPKNFEVSQNYPNPFNPSTRINYSLPFDSRVTVEVYNITGERMGQIVNQEQSAGYYSVNFNSSSLYRSIASGVYIYRVSAVEKASGKSFSSIKKMMLLK